MRNQKGITLVALVVTIVVLLILAGTSIAMLSGDTGILTNATRAKAANTEGEVTDAMKMAFNAAKMQDISDLNMDITYTRNINNIANIIAKELGGTGTEFEADGSKTDSGTIGKGYKITLEFSDTNKKLGTITMTYTDDTFNTASKQTSSKYYDDIKMKVTVNGDALTLGAYSMQTATAK